MRRILLLLVILTFLAPNVKGVSSLADPSDVNLIISVIKTPQLEPGDKGTVELTLFNPYVNDMTNVNLTASIYLYVSWEEEIAVDSSWDWDEPYFQEDGKGIRDHTWSFATLEPGVLGQQNISATLVTSLDAPHGGILNQGSYFVRFELEFDYVHPSNGTSEHALMRSRGFFSTAQWEFATQDPVIQNDPNYLGGVNLTHLGVSGILADTSFGVLEPFPAIVLYALVVAAAVALILALLFYLEENPEKWPGLANPWIRFRSSMKQSKRISQKKKDDANSRKKV
jgi:hypothetical protein